MQELAPDHREAAAPASYEVEGQRFEAGSAGFADAIADAHAERRRPRCMCVDEGVEMYVARLAGASSGFIVKRIPDTGSQHAPDCPSYEPPADVSGLGQVLGTAIREDPETGQTLLKLDFAMSKMAGRSTMPPAGRESVSVASNGTKLSLRGLLHYLWDQAGLSRWHPGFAGRRTWATVHRHLLLAAENKTTCGDPLRSRLYVPEAFSVDQREAISARRTAQWARAIPAPGKPQRMLILIAEVKEIVPARYGFKAVVKHLPDQTFVLDDRLFHRLGRRFGPELSLWGAADDVHMVMIASFSVAAAGVPSITELSLMPVTRHWLPIDDAFEKQLVDKLVDEGRSFVKGLRYNLGPGSALACATLTDCDGSGQLLFVGLATGDGDGGQQWRTGPHAEPVWLWRPTDESMPPLPGYSTAHRLSAAPSPVDRR